MAVCSCSRRSLDACTRLKDILPPPPSESFYKVCDYTEGAATNCFDATVRMPLTTADEVAQWIKELEGTSFIKWRKKRTFPNRVARTVLKVVLRCQHNTRPRAATADMRKGSKNTYCPTTMSMTVKKVEHSRGRNRSKDPHVVAGYATKVEIQWQHNHELRSADVLRHRDVGPDARDKVRALFRAGHSPSSALDTLKYDLQAARGDDYPFASLDRALCPDLQYCYRLFYAEFKDHGRKNGDVSTDSLRRRLESYNCEVGQACAKLEVTAAGQTLVAVCSPLMKRVHATWKPSGESVSVNSSGGTDRKSCPVFLFSARCEAGALPLGVVVATNETEATLTAAFALLKSLLPAGAFFRGEDGPGVFLTEDCVAVRGALRAAWPVARTLLCHCHLLRAAWRWLWEERRGVAREDRPHLLQLLRTVLVARQEDELARRCAAIDTDATAAKYATYVAYVQCAIERRVEGGWVPAVEASCCDRVFHRLRAYNVAQVADFVVTRFDEYHRRRLTDVAAGRLPGHAAVSLLYPTDADVDIDTIMKVSADTYTVENSRGGGAGFDVDMSLHVCTCAGGRTGAPCTHQALVLRHFGVEALGLAHVRSSSLRSLLRYIGTGDDAALGDHWVRSLDTGAGNDDDDDDDADGQDDGTDGLCDNDDLYDTADADIRYDEHSGVKEALQEFVVDLTKHLDENAAEYAPAVESFLKSYHGFSTDSGRLTALQTFGETQLSSSAENSLSADVGCLQEWLPSH